MTKTWKWVLGIGTAVTAGILISLIFFSRFWLAATSFMPFNRGMRGGFHYAPYITWSPIGVLIFGVFVLLLIFFIVFQIIRSKPNVTSVTVDAKEPLEICPGCGADLEPNWNYCPFCDYDLV